MVARRQPASAGGQLASPAPSNYDLGSRL